MKPLKWKRSSAKKASRNRKVLSTDLNARTESELWTLDWLKLENGATESSLFPTVLTRYGGQELWRKAEEGGGNVEEIRMLRVGDSRLWIVNCSLQGHEKNFEIPAKFNLILTFL